MNERLQTLAGYRQRNLLDACKAVGNKTPLEQLRYSAATKRSLEVTNLPPVLFHESGNLSGNYLYSKTVYPVADSNYRKGDVESFQGKRIFAHGIV